MTEAVLVCDMTRDSIAPEARALDQRLKVLPRTKEFLAWARKTGRPVVFICSARRRTDKWFLKFWELANEMWKPGQDPIPELFDAQKDLIVHKRRYSGFFGSDLDITLRELEVTSLVLLGWSTSLAVLSTALDGWQHGYAITAVSDLTVAHAWGGRSPEENQQWSLDYIKAFGYARIATSTELMR